MVAHPNMEQQLTARLQAELEPVELQVINESHLHSGPAQESHFRLVVVSAHFAEKSRIQRHRLVNTLLAEQMQRIHALALSLYTPEEWEQQHQSFTPSPNCASKHSP